MEENSEIYPVSEDEYLHAAVQIFEKCGPVCSELLPVETIMKVMAPFIGCKKSEYRYLYSIVDPEGSNPSISVKSLASALKQYSDKNNTTIDNSCVSMSNGDTILDPVLSEGFHDTFTHLECELRERTHMMHKLQKQLEFTDRHHEEAMSAIMAERDQLRANLQAMRDQNTSLLFVKEENREISEWSLSTERKLAENSLELNMLRKRTRTLQELVEKLKQEKQSLNEILLKSKEEHTRVSDIYSNRQTVLLEDNELLKGEVSELERRHGDQDRLIQQLLKDKERLEIDMKDILNRSTRMEVPFCPEQSIDVSRTDESILRALDSLNSDFADEKNASDFEQFPNISHKEDYGRPSNVSLFDELRSVDFETELYSEIDVNSSKWRQEKSLEPFKMIDFSTVSCQTDFFNDNCVPCKKEIENNNNNNYNEKTPCMCKEYAETIIQLNSDLIYSKNKIHRMLSQIDCYKENINALNYSIEQYEEKNNVYESDLNSLNAKIYKLEKEKIKELSDMMDTPEVTEKLSQTETCLMKEISIQTEMYEFLATAYIHIDNSTQTESIDLEKYSTESSENREFKTKTRELFTQTEIFESHDRCIQTEICDTQELFTQTEICETQELFTQTEMCETQELFTQTEICEIEEHCAQTETCETQKQCTQTEICKTQELCTQTETFNVEDKLSQTEQSCDVVEILKSTLTTQTENPYGVEQCDIATQYDNGCEECLKRSLETPTSPSKRGLMSRGWNSLRSTLHLLTVLCFILAILLLYNVMHYSMTSRRCIRPSGFVPWDWMTLADVLSLVFRIEYVGEVPM